MHSPPQMNTPNLQLQMEKFPLNKDLELAEQLLHRNSRLPPEIRKFSNWIIPQRARKATKTKFNVNKRKETEKIGAETNKIQAKKNKRSIKLKVFSLKRKNKVLKSLSGFTKNKRARTQINKIWNKRGEIEPDIT